MSGVNGSFLDSNGLSYFWGKIKSVFSKPTLGTAIPSNANLNSATYMVPGTYNAKSNAIAASISNAPTSNGFRLEVTSIISDTTYIRQTVYPNNDTGYFYARRRKDSTWSDWVTFKPVSDTISDVFGLNIEIPSGNLNDYTTSGTYYVKNNTIASSITNIPKFLGSAYGGRLEVKYTISTARIVQLYYPNLAGRNIFFERTRTSDSAWDPWYMHMSMPAQQLIPSSADLDDYTTPGSYYAGVTTSAGLSNNPWTVSGIKLIVMQTIASDRFIQILFPSPYAAQTSSSHIPCDGIFIRAYGTDGWQQWYKLQGTLVTIPSA